MLIAAAIGCGGDAEYRYSVDRQIAATICDPQVGCADLSEILPTSRRSKLRSIAQLAMKKKNAPAGIFTKPIGGFGQCREQNRGFCCAAERYAFCSRTKGAEPPWADI